MSTTLVSIVIGLFILLLFLGIWLSAELNTRAEKQRSLQRQNKITKLEKALEKAHKHIKHMENELLELKELQHDLRIAQNNQAALQKKNERLIRQRQQIFQVLEKLRKKAKELEFADSHLARQVTAHLDQILDQPSTPSTESTHTFSKIRNKING